jgi:hypothetical protein
MSSNCGFEHRFEPFSVYVRRRGRALLEQRAPAARALDRIVALTTLARRCFKSRGPAQLKDFA